MNVKNRIGMKMKIGTIAVSEKAERLVIANSIGNSENRLVVQGPKNLTAERHIQPSTKEFIMKTKCFLSLAFFAVVLTFFACSGGGGSDDPVATPSSNSGPSLCAGEAYDPDLFRCDAGELIGKCAGQDYYPAYQQCNNGVVENKNGSSYSSSSDGNDIDTPSSNSGPSLCAGEVYDTDIFRCEAGELIGKCAGQDYYPAYQQCNNGVVEDKNMSSSSSFTQSLSSVSSSSNKTCAKNSLGLGYNVLNSGYPNAKEVGSYPILDQNKMCQDDIIEFVPSSLQDFSQGTGNSIRDFYQNMNFDLKLSASIDIAIFFSASLDASFSVNSSTSASQNYFYSQLRSYRYMQDDRIKSGEVSVQNISKYLSSTFIFDLQTKSAAQILDLYGTHVFIQYYKGGSLQSNYVYMGTTFTSSNEMAAAVKGSLSKFNASISGGLGTAESITELEQHMSFNYKACGGNALEVSGINQLGNAYNPWVSSIQSNPELCGIKDFSNSFISIWDLVNAVEGQSAKALALYNEFAKRAEERGIYISSVSPIPCTSADNSSTHYCSKGFLKGYDFVTYDMETYRTVVIGTQTWLTENLKTGGKTVYDNDYAAISIYGVLNEDIPKLASICPSGWHVPSPEEWNDLISFVESDSKCTGCAGVKLKARSGWNNNGNGTDDYGFAALPAGCANCGVNYYEDRGISGYWWGRNSAGAGSCVKMSSDRDNIVSCGTIAGFSVRCIKN